jgi:hypothetical protein
MHKKPDHLSDRAKCSLAIVLGLTLTVATSLANGKAGAKIKDFQVTIQVTKAS